jgi:hypothetical protein
MISGVHRIWLAPSGQKQNGSRNTTSCRPTTLPLFKAAFLHKAKTKA